MRTPIVFASAGALASGSAAYAAGTHHGHRVAAPHSGMVGGITGMTGTTGSHHCPGMTS
ncbi:MAG: hypothetical protein ABSC56_09995 [Solirubrobacteraceae bacterium]